MIAQIPADTREIPPYALWMLSGWILSTLISGWIGYRSGLRSQQQAELLKAKHAALCQIDRDRDALEFMAIGEWLYHGQTKLRPLLFAVSSQVRSDRKRIRIERECAKYHNLDIEHWAGPIEQQRDQMRKILHDLRTTIQRA